MGLFDDGKESALFQAIRMNEALKAKKTWEKRRKRVFFDYIKKYIDKGHTLEIDNNLMSSKGLRDLSEYDIMQYMQDYRPAIYNYKDFKSSTYEIILTTMNSKDEISAVSLETIYANSDIEARNKAYRLIVSGYLNVDGKNVTYASIDNINRFLNKLEINKIEMSKYLEILYRKQFDELLGFYIKDENGIYINFNYFKMEE